MRQLAQSTSRVVTFKAFLATDHTTPATGKTIAVVISKNGGSFANPNAGATNATEMANGWYKVTLDTTDTDTIGDLIVRGTNADIDPAETLCQVAQTPAAALTAYDPPTNAEMEARTLAAASYATAANQVTILGYIDTEVAAILAAVDTEVAAIKAVTDNLPDSGALTSLATAAALQTVDDEIATLDGVADAIKAKTDSLAFTVAGQVDANVTYVNEIEVGGAGTEADPWGPA